MDKAEKADGEGSSSEGDDRHNQDLLDGVVVDADDSICICLFACAWTSLCMDRAVIIVYL